MIDQVDDFLRAWIKSIVGEINITDDLFSPDNTTPTVSLYLLQVVPRLPEQPPGRQRAPLKLTLRYLITTHAPDTAQAHRLLGELAFAAMDTSDLEIDLNPLSLSDWAALQCRPQPCVVLNVLLTQERPEVPAKSVLRPKVRQPPPVSLHGVVLGPGDVPLAGATIEIPNLQYLTRTNNQGQFTIPAMPNPKPGPQQIIVRARGHETRLRLDNVTADAAPIVIRLNLPV
ncbi:MAG TPA: Pvc16 family protein [Phototrophicaceae bacterium]|nr:Pvc16 family protein [Phototrophicaceae bacterium]